MENCKVSWKNSLGTKFNLCFSWGQGCPMCRRFTHAVVGIFYPRPFFAAKITIVCPLPLLYNVESIAEALSYLERHNIPFQCFLYHLRTTLFYRGGDFVVCLQHKSQEVFQDFWHKLYIHIICSK